MNARHLSLAFVLAALATSASAHVPLVHPGNGNTIHWGRPFDVSIVINATGSEDITDGSHVTALRNAIDAWNSVGETTFQLDENTSPSQRARTDWASDSVHLLWFDEDDDSGYFPGGTGIVALTPVYFANSGAILDADVLFNGNEFQFTTRGTAGRFDVQDVATHELGHLAGLDHSGWASATMYPYVDTHVILHRSLSLDDVRGIRATYPASTLGALRGTLRRSGSQTVVVGAHVVALDSSGRPCASALTNSMGAFSLLALPAGDFELYAAPLDGPVGEINLGAGHPVDVDFAATSLGTWTLAAGEDRTLLAQYLDADVALVLGRNNDDYPLRAIIGQTRSFIVRGTGLVNGCTLVASDPDLVVNPITWLGSQVSFDVTTPSNAPLGHADLIVENPAGERSILTGALEITPRDPLVTNVAPGVGPKSGGTALTITGARFVPGSRVVIGGSIYADGASGGCTVVDPTTIQLTTHANASGNVDVVVIDPAGDEGRALSAFRFDAIPALDTVFPAAGSASGGTLLTLLGSDFEDGCTVTIDGIAQQVEFVDATQLRVTTSAYPAGGPYVLEVVNPFGATATAAYAYALDPDPVVMQIDPAIGSASGGDQVIVHGANFQPTIDVWFGADALTGAGGTPAAELTYVDSTTLIVVTPAYQSGVHDLVLRDALTGQATSLASAFTFTGSSGGGGCSIAPHAAPPAAGPRELLASGAWIGAVLACLWLRTQRLRRRAA